MKHTISCHIHKFYGYIYPSPLNNVNISGLWNPPYPTISDQGRPAIAARNKFDNGPLKVDTPKVPAACLTKFMLSIDWVVRWVEVVLGNWGEMSATYYK